MFVFLLWLQLLLLLVSVVFFFGSMLRQQEENVYMSKSRGGEEGIFDKRKNC